MSRSETGDLLERIADTSVTNALTERSTAFFLWAPVPGSAGRC
jgi:hypothetical protein